MTRIRIRSILKLLAMLAVISFGHSAIAQVVLLGPDLEPQTYTLQALSNDAVQVVDWQDKSQTLDVAGVLRLTFGTERQDWSSNEYVLARLRDGQALAGHLVASDDDESIRLRLGNQRTVDLALDDLLSLSMQRDSAVPVVEDDDVLLLATGETLTGFVETISDESVGFIIGDADDPIDIPLERIKALAIANKPKSVEHAPGLMRVVLADDSSLLLRDVRLTEDDQGPGQVLVGKPLLAFEPASFEVPLQQVSRIEPMSGRYALTALTARPMQLVAGGEVFGIAMPPRVGPGNTIRLHAPTTIGFKLPEGASRLAMTVTLDLGDDVPRGRRALAGCELVIYDGDAVIGGCELSANQPTHRLNLPLEGRNLRIELKSGVNGPVLDRVLITDAEVLVSKS